MASDSELLGGDSKCEAWPLDHIDNDDQISSCPKFSFCLQALLSRPVVVVVDHDQEEEEEEDQLLVPPDIDNMVDSVNVFGEKPLDYDVVMDEERSKVAIKDMLSEIGVVPVQDFMVQRILDTALSMSKNKRFVGRKVCIEAVVDELPPSPPPPPDDEDDGEDMVEFEPPNGVSLAELDDGDDEDMTELDDDDYDYDEYEDMVELDGEDWEPKFEPASRVSIEELERVKVEGCEEEAGCCSVCFDDFQTGCEATRMPCSHLFHGDCIVKWLQNSKFCPLCRFQMPSL